jgi:hypothetical protein
MRLSKLLIILTVIQAHLAYSQWHQLGPITYTALPTGGIVPQTFTVSPNVAAPVKDGKIYFGTTALVGNHGSEVKLYVSNDDYQTFQNVFSLYDAWTPAASFSSINSLNDTVVSANYYFSPFAKVKFTFNNFNTSFENTSTLLKGAHCLTNKYHYQITKAFVSAPYTNALNPNVVAQLERRDTSMVLTSFQLPQYLGESGKDKNLLFTNDSVGYFLARHRNNQFKTLLLKTQDFGATWTETAVDSVNPIVSFCFPSTNVGYFLKSNGAVFKTTDAGFSWNQLYAAVSGTFNCIKFSDNMLGYIGGNAGVLLKTIDGGINWQNDFSNTTGNIKDLYAFSGDVAYFVLSDNKIFKNQANYVGIKEIAEVNAGMNIYPNPATDEITIDLSQSKENIQSLTIINVLGETVFQKQDIDPNPGQIQQVSLKDFYSGNYFVIAETKTRVVRKKITVIK